MNRIVRPLVVALCCSSFALAGEPIAVNKLPEVITKAVMERFPDAELLSAETDTEEGKKLYEVTIRAEGKVKDVELTPEGKIVAVEDAEAADAAREGGRRGRGRGGRG
jgi:hypothetical protein